jgi:hypothetical protein
MAMQAETARFAQASFTKQANVWYLTQVGGQSNLSPLTERGKQQVSALASASR